ncbi:alpha/beta hydrolase [Levilactobacillus namurensis]|uniref:alpha/beta hydrolase n=1 Tax=Levilactobacillus namurensis TaxID=380393 RepID=UPI001D3A7F6F|nr:alpha/beta hydrolase [Levilactobacillus namurensis]HJE45305.1 alpha/beta hydrolase [Levilactobacillus namurensis]
MKFWTKQRLGGLGLILGLLLLLAIPGLFWRSQQLAQVRANYRSPMAPIIMVPGSSANQNRFNQLVQQLNTEIGTQHSLLRVEVLTNGQLKTTGTIRKGDYRPFIVVGFQDSRDGPANIQRQAKWFTIAFKSLQKAFHFNRFSAMGHSNGGLVLTLFMEHDLQATGAHAERLMTIGTPFNLEEWDTSVETPLFKELVADRQSLPKELVVYSIAGTETYGGDGIVPVDSVNRGKYIFQKQVKSFTQVTVTGTQAKHGGLPENQQIIKLMRQDLLK